MRRSLALPSGPADVWADDRADGQGGESGEAAGEAGREGGLAGSSSGGLVSSSAYLDDLDDDDEDETKCAICFSGPRDAVLLECGHGGICYTCARRCLRKKGRECPMCRAPVEQVVQIRLDGVPSSPQHTGVVPVKQSSLP